MRLRRKTLEKTDKTGPKLSEKGFDNYGKMMHQPGYLYGGPVTNAVRIESVSGA